MTGAPMRGVTAFNGMTPLSPGKKQMRLQIRATTEPQSKVAGNN